MKKSEIKAGKFYLLRDKTPVIALEIDGKLSLVDLGLMVPMVMYTDDMKSPDGFSDYDVIAEAVPVYLGDEEGINYLPI